MEEMGAFYPADPEPVAQLQAESSPPPDPAARRPESSASVALPGPETARYSVRYGLLGQVAAATISVKTGPQPERRTLHATGQGSGAVLGFGQTEKRIESEFDLQTLISTRWTATRNNDKGTVTDIVEQRERGKISLVRKRPGRPDQTESFTRPTAVLDPLGLLLRIRFGPMSAPSSFEILDGRALWVVRFSSIQLTNETPPTLRLNGHVEPIFRDGSPDKERTGRDFSLFLSNDSARTPIRLVVPFGLGHARAEIIQLSKNEATSREEMKNPATTPKPFGALGKPRPSPETRAGSFAPSIPRTTVACNSPFAVRSSAMASSPGKGTRRPMRGTWAMAARSR